MNNCGRLSNCHIRQLVRFKRAIYEGDASRAMAIAAELADTPSSGIGCIAIKAELLCLLSGPEQAPEAAIEPRLMRAIAADARKAATEHQE